MFADMPVQLNLHDVLFHYTTIHHTSGPIQIKTFGIKINLLLWCPTGESSTFIEYKSIFYFFAVC